MNYSSYQYEVVWVNMDLVSDSFRRDEVKSQLIDRAEILGLNFLSLESGFAFSGLLFNVEKLFDYAQSSGISEASRRKIVLSARDVE